MTINKENCVHSSNLWRSYMYSGTFNALNRNVQNVPSHMCAQRRLRSACASTQADQSLHCPLKVLLHPWLLKCTRRRSDQTVFFFGAHIRRYVFWHCGSVQHDSENMFEIRYYLLPIAQEIRWVPHKLDLSTVLGSYKTRAEFHNH